MIKKATYLHDYLLEVTFRDGGTRVIDLEDFFKLSGLTLVKKFANPLLFSKFRVEGGTLCWGDNECEINPYYIHEGRYDAKYEYA